MTVLKQHFFLYDFILFYNESSDEPSVPMVLFLVAIMANYEIFLHNLHGMNGFSIMNLKQDG